MSLLLVVKNTTNERSVKFDVLLSRVSTTTEVRILANKSTWRRRLACVVVSEIVPRPKS
jgi:hypothetical protein